MGIKRQARECALQIEAAAGDRLIGQRRQRIRGDHELPDDIGIRHRRELRPNQRRGTGHAVRIALDEILLQRQFDHVMVVYGDTPLLSAGTLSALWETHTALGIAATVLTAEVADPTGYGRILRDSTGAVAGIVEQRDASAEQLQIREINSGIYAFEVAALRAALTAALEHGKGVVHVLGRLDRLAAEKNRGGEKVEIDLPFTIFSTCRVGRPSALSLR